MEEWKCNWNEFQMNCASKACAYIPISEARSLHKFVWSLGPFLTYRTAFAAFISCVELWPFSSRQFRRVRNCRVHIRHDKSVAFEFFELKSSLAQRDAEFKLVLQHHHPFRTISPIHSNNCREPIDKLSWGHKNAVAKTNENKLKNEIKIS